ncbi:hypothetical protein VTJ04DRAFT_4128 [Mycothermus thermophilus]|uniref:uncharacterized protein n=1 Tax=Humicola insolens TaxID=85995 RepID=UPI0037437971
MPETTVYELHPLGWETDPEEERLTFGILDYFSGRIYDAYALFFKLPDEARSKALAVLKEGLEKTLAQCRHMVGTLEQDKDTYECFFHKKRDTTVKLIVKYFGPEDGVPSLEEIEKAHYASGFLDVTKFSVEGLLTTERPEYHPSEKPVSSAFQLNFIPGGLVFVTSQHHYVNDLTGWANFVRQLADNCSSIVNKTPPPPWDPANLDVSPWVIPDVPSESKVDGPSPPEPNPLIREQTCVLLHIPLRMATRLKRLAFPTEETITPKWISTYDAVCAFLWRVLTRHRLRLYSTDPNITTPLVAEAVNLRPRTSPSLPSRHQRNLFWAAISAVLPDPLTAAQVAAQESEVPLSRLAAKIRTMTNSVEQKSVLQFLSTVVPVRDKTRLFRRPNSFPPLSFVITDWRDADFRQTDFGFARPCAFRHFFMDTVSIVGLVVMYPPRLSDNPDEGYEFLVAVENDILDDFVEDSEGIF